MGIQKQHLASKAETRPHLQDQIATQGIQSLNFLKKNKTRLQLQQVDICQQKSLDFSIYISQSYEPHITNSWMQKKRTAHHQHNLLWDKLKGISEPSNIELCFGIAWQSGPVVDYAWFPLGQSHWEANANKVTFPKCNLHLLVFWLNVLVLLNVALLYKSPNGFKRKLLA